MLSPDRVGQERPAGYTPHIDERTTRVSDSRPESQRLSQFAFYGTVLLIGWLAWRIVQPFIGEIGWAVVLAICVEPIRERLSPRLGRGRTAALLTALVFLLIVIPLLFVAVTLIREAQPAIAYVEAQLKSQGGAAAWFHGAWEWLRSRVPVLPAEDEVIASVTSSLGRVAQVVASRAGSILASAAGMVFSLLITVAVLFFLLRDASEFAAAVRRVLPFGPAQNARLMAIADQLVFASVSATVAIAAVQGVIGGVTFAVLGIQGAVVWGTVMALLAFLPLVGAALVWAPAAIWLALSGSLAKGLVLAGVGVLVMGQVDNVVRPLLLSGKAQMNTLVLIISLMGGVSAFGFIGVVLGPLVAALLTAIIESYQAAPADPASNGGGAPEPAREAAPGDGGTELTATPPESTVR